MRTVQHSGKTPNRPSFPNSISLFRGRWGKLGRALALAVLTAAACSSAEAQYVGYAANSADGTVSVFAVVTSGPTFGNQAAPGNSDILISTVSVGKTPVRIAVTPSPNSDRAYVTNQGDNSLWVIDVTKISQEAIFPGSVTAQNVNPSNSLQLSQPGGIAIVSATGANKGHVLAFVANQGNNTVSIIDISNNTLFGTVTLGAAGASTTTPEVAATPDGTAVFVTNNSTGNCPPSTAPATSPCPGLWMIDATTVVSGGAATPIPVSGLNVNHITISLAQPQGISTTQYTDSLGQKHTLVLVADSGSHSDSEGYVFVVDRLSGKTIFTLPQVLGVGAIPTGVVAMNFGGLGIPASVGAAAIESSNANGEGIVVAFTIQLPLTCCNINFLPSVLGGLPTSVGVANPTGATQFIYVTESSGPTPVELGTFDNTTFCFGSTFPCSTGNATAVKVGNGPTGLTFSNLDPNSPPVAWFIPTVSGGFGPPPAVVAANSGLSITGESMVGAGQAVSTTLSFGGTNSCTLFGTDTTGPACANSNAGTNAIGGNTTFPASGVFTVSITNSSTDSSGNPTSTRIQQQVSVGANCTLSVSPTNILVGLTVNASLSCTAPVGDTLAGTINWGDGSSTQSETITKTVLVGSQVSLGFTPHQYVGVSAPTFANGYPVTVTLQDQPANVAGSVVPASLGLTVTAPTCTVAVAPNPAQTTQMVTATLSCMAQPGFPLSETINWGDGTPVLPPISTTVNSDGTATLMFTHAYANPSNPSYPVSFPAFEVTINGAAFPGIVTNQPVNVAVGLACTLSATPTTAATGATVTANLNCGAPAGNSLSGTLNWGDGTTTALNATANASGAVTLSVTHVYSTPSTPTYSISATITDTTIGLKLVVSPPSVAITAATPTRPIITPPPPPPPIVPGQSVTVPVTFSSGAADAGITFSISCQVLPAGPTCSVSPSTLTLDANGNGTVQVTVTTIGPSTALVVPRSGTQQASLFAVLIALPGVGLMLLGEGIFRGGPRRCFLLASSFLFLICLAALAVGCGSSVQRSNLGCTTCTTAGTYTVTVTAVSQKPVLQANGVFTILVKQ
jgi:YVTN family beta-propeller protein